MNTFTFDFKNIADQNVFFREFARQFAFEGDSVRDLDSLWDIVVAGALPLPLEIVFINLSEKERRRFGALILLFDQAEEELDGKLRFNVK